MSTNVSMKYGNNKCIRAVATEIFGKIWVANEQTHGRGAETQLSLIGAELSSTNFKSSVKAERSFAMGYTNIVIKPLCGSLDICLN